MPPDPETPRERVARQAREFVRRTFVEMETRVLLGLPACRTFVCQGCGAAHEAAFAYNVKCGCGETRIGEIVP